MAAEAGEEEMAITSTGRRCLAFDSLILLERAILSQRPFGPQVASHVVSGLAWLAWGGG